MPANLYRGQDARDIAVYIAKCSGNPNCGVSATNVGAPPAATTTTAGGGGGSAKPDGKKVFTSAGCGGCHTLKDAGTSGNVGPNLDQLKPSEARVAHQVEVGGGPMPSFKAALSAKQMQDVAAFVATSTHS